MTFVSRAASVIALVAMAACSQGRSGAPSDPAVASVPLRATPSIAPAFDLQSVMARVHFAFRASGTGSFVAEHPTHRAEVKRGALSFEPFSTTVGPAVGGRGAPLKLETISATRGGSSVLGEGSARITEAGNLRLTRGAIEEDLENRADGIEQSWTFAAAPKGTGDLVVRLRVQGEKYAGLTEHGLHFVDPLTGLGVRYGVAQFVDAKGTSNNVATTYRDGEIVLKVPETVLATAAYPAVLDPTIGAEFGIDNPVVSIEASVDSPAIAADGTNFLLVWSDPRAGIDPAYGGAKRGIYGARIAASGALLDPIGFVIAPSAGYYQSSVTPAVAYGGGEYLVVWSDGRPNTSSSFYNSDIYAARVTPAGAVLDATGIAVSTASKGQTDPKVVFDGTRFFVVWTDNRNEPSPSTPNSDIYGAQVSVAGVVAQPSGIAISIGAKNEVLPAVGWSGSNYVVAWSDCRANTGWCTSGEGYATRVTTAGLVSDPSGIALGGPAPKPAVACGAGECLVTWASANVLGRKIGSSGVVGTAATTIVTTSNAEAPSVAFDGTNYMVAWSDWRGSGVPYSPHAFATRVTTSLAAVDGTGVALGPSTTVQRYPVIAYDGSANCLVAWLDYRHSAANWSGNGSVQTLYGTRLSKTTSVLDSPNLALTKANNPQSKVAVESDGTNYLVAWTDQRNAGSDIYAARVSSTGTILDTSGIAVSTAIAIQRNPRISFDGTNYFVVWQDYRTPDTYGYYQDSAVYGARVSPSGTLLDGPAATGGIKVCGVSSDSPAVAFNGTHHVVVLNYNDSTGTGTMGIVSVRIGKDGVVADSTPNSIATSMGWGGAQRYNPAVASNVTNTLAVWTDNRAGTYGTYASRLGADGKPLDGTGFVVSNTANQQWYQAVAGNGTDYLVAWSEAASGAPYDVYAARVRGAAATVVDTTPIAIAKGAYDKGAPTVAYTKDGLNYVVGWHDRRGGNYNIYASWIDMAKGTNLDPSGVLISGDTSDESEPRVASSTAGKVLFAYQRHVASPTDAVRIRARLVTSGTLSGIACTTGNDCASRYCVDGVCCSSACNSPCQTCAATPGTCTTVISADDPDSCPTSTSTCNSAGVCKKKLGQGCGAATDCASNFCVDGYCCNSACTGGCDRCSSTGTCAAVSAGTPGTNPSCAPYVCTGGSACPTSCTTDATCEAGYYCSAGGTCERRKNNGETCNLTTDCAVSGCRECTSGNCVDGVCCDTACAGGCDVCNATAGTCSVVAAGAAGASPACAPYVCIGLASCPTACTSDVQCASGFYCGPAGTCIAQKAKGAACSTTTDCKTTGCRVCSTGQCVDSVCCDTACAGTCQACAAALKTSGIDGECGNAATGRDPHNDCPTDAESTCQRDGTCNGTGGCRLYTAGVACGSSLCDGSVAKGQLCDGLGVCKSTPSGTECGPFMCKSGSCTTTCATSADCATNAWCDAGLCKLRVANGQKCTVADSCTSNLCVDGYCCNAPCSGTCEACDVAGGEGTCVPVSGDPHGSRPKCDLGSPSEPCKATKCDGIERATCAGYAGSTVRCREASCMGGSAITSAQCDGKGTCPAGEPQTCGAYTCGDTACKTTCTASSDCATNFACDTATSKCVPSAVCDGNHTITGAGGVTTSCAPFKCEANGQCKSTCASSEDCVAPNLCNSGACQAPPSAEAEDSGGCMTSSSRAASPFTLAALALALAATRRRRARC